MKILQLDQSCFSFLSTLTNIYNRFSKFQVQYNLKIIQFALNTMKEELSLCLPISPTLPSISKRSCNQVMQSAKKYSNLLGVYCNLQ